jgi:hypothetical protein
MGESRWVRWIAPGLFAVWAVGAISAATVGASVSGAQWVPAACPGPTSRLMQIIGAAAPTTSSGARGAPWYRLDPQIGRDGSLTGQQLSVGVVGESVVRSIALPSESFAAGPFGPVILVGADDGRTSRLQAVDVSRRCSWSIGQATDVIRRATIDPSGTSIFEMRVARTGRADLGVWRRLVAGVGEAERVGPPPDPDVRFGRTYATEFMWNTAGTRVGVESCGEIACRTRLLDPEGGLVASIDDPALGPLVGIDGDTVLNYGACRGLPCPIFATDARSGSQHAVVADGGPAVILQTSVGSQLVDEASVGVDRRLRSTDVASGAASDLGPMPSGQALLPTPDRASSGTRIPRGWVVLAPDGRLPGGTSSPGALLRHVPDGLTVPIDEAIR